MSARDHGRGLTPSATAQSCLCVTCTMAHPGINITQSVVGTVAISDPQCCTHMPRPSHCTGPGSADIHAQVLLCCVMWPLHYGACSCPVIVLQDAKGYCQLCAVWATGSAVAKAATARPPPPPWHDGGYIDRTSMASRHARAYAHHNGCASS